MISIPRSYTSRSGVGTSTLDPPFDRLPPRSSTTNEPERPPSNEIVHIGVEIDLYYLDDGKPPGAAWGRQSLTCRLTAWLLTTPPQTNLGVPRVTRLLI